MGCEVVVALCAGDQYPAGNNESAALARFDIDVVLGPTKFLVGAWQGPLMPGPPPKLINGTWFVPQLEYKRTQTITTLDLSIAAGRVETAPVTVDYPPGIESAHRSGPHFRRAVAWLQAQLDAAHASDYELATSTAPMPDGRGTSEGIRIDPCRHRECALGNLAADALLTFTRTNPEVDLANASVVSIVNGGALQVGWDEGGIWKSDIQRAFPFANYLCHFATTGPELWATIEKAISPVQSNGEYNHTAPNKGGFPQVSGLRFTVDYSRPKLARIISMSVRNPVTGVYEHISRRKTYYVATLSYLCDGGDGYHTKKIPGTLEKTMREMKDVLIGYLRSLGEYTPHLDGRIENVGFSAAPSLLFYPLKPEDCSTTERWLSAYDDCEPCPPGMVHPVPGESACISNEAESIVRWIIIGVVLFVVAIGVGIALYCRSRGRMVEREVGHAKQTTKGLRDINQVAKDLARAVARMDLFGQTVEDIFTQDPPSERERIVLAFRDIICFLREFRAFLPDAVIAQARGKGASTGVGLNRTFDAVPSLDNTARLSAAQQASADNITTPLLPRSDCVSATMWAPPVGALQSQPSGVTGDDDGSQPDIWMSGTLVSNALRAKEATLLCLDAGGRHGGDENTRGCDLLGARVRRFLSTIITESRRFHSVTMCVGADSALLGWNTIFTHRGRKGQHTVDACKCAGGLKRDLPEGMWSGIGIARGTVLVGYSGSEKQRSPVVVGQPVRICDGLALLAPRVRAGVLVDDGVNKVLRGLGQSDAGLSTRPVDRVQWAGVGEHLAATCYELAPEHTAAAAEYALAFEHLCANRTASARDVLIQVLLHKDPADEQACRLLRIALLLQARRRRGKAKGYVRTFQGWEDLEQRAARLNLPDDLGDLRDLAAMQRYNSDVTECTQTLRLSMSPDQTMAQQPPSGGGLPEGLPSREQSPSVLRRTRMRDASFIRREIRNWENVIARIASAEVLQSQVESVNDSVGLSPGQAAAARERIAESSTARDGGAPTDAPAPELDATGFDVVDSEPDSPQVERTGDQGDPLSMGDVFGEVHSENDDGDSQGEGKISMGDVFGEVASEDDDGNGDCLNMGDVFGEVASEDDDDSDGGNDRVATVAAAPPKLQVPAGDPAECAKASSAPKEETGPTEPRKRLYTTNDGRKWHASNHKLGSGAGNISEVWQGMGDDGSLVALKVLPLRLSGADAEERRRRQAKADAMLREVQLLERELRHENVVAYLGAGFDTFRNASTGGADAELLVVMEYCSGGSLERVLETFGAAPVNAAQRYTVDIVAGLAFLHSRYEPVVHGDLRGTNVLMTISGNCRLSDIAGCCDPAASCSALHLPPEASQPEGRAQPPADIWSLGFLVCRLLTGKADPCYGVAAERLSPVGFIGELYSQRIKPRIPQDMPPDARSFVQCCLLHDPAARAKAGRQHGGRRQGGELGFLGDHPFLVSPQNASAAPGEDPALAVPALRRVRQLTPPIIVLGSPPADPLSREDSSRAPPAPVEVLSPAAPEPAAPALPSPPEEQLPRGGSDSAAAPLPPQTFTGPPPSLGRLASAPLPAAPCLAPSSSGSSSRGASPHRRPHIADFLPPRCPLRPSPRGGCSRIPATLLGPPVAAASAGSVAMLRPRCPLAPDTRRGHLCNGGPLLAGGPYSPPTLPPAPPSNPLLMFPGSEQQPPPVPGVRRTPL
eukprot:TRINITY_DN3754_c0_g1_i1.p1 TRINITY_DN3754_c0_g1~~TRINITY_DN3754_c0_g1_i1.p1  ORF type:complete len:1689 (+),score=277.04 TRINITY_DN3754_c0_g1_i1:166-5232(+)